MSERNIELKENAIIKKCPKCSNNTEFKIISQQVAEDCCDIWAVCKCGYDPTFNNTLFRVESVWGGTDFDSCQDALYHSWNEAV